MITVNLESFLQRLRKVDSSRVVWADAICIDQSNIDERNSQVMLMAQIYTNATCVQIWLGEADEHTELAFDTATKLFHLGTQRRLGRSAGATSTLTETKSKERKLKSHTLRHFPRRAFDKLMTIIQRGEGRSAGRSAMIYATPTESKSPASLLSSDTFPEVSEAQVTALKSTFSERAWWTRIWIVQECVLASEAVIMCGTYSLPWNAVDDIKFFALCTIDRDNRLGNQLSFLNSWLNLRGLNNRCFGNYHRVFTRLPLYKLLDLLGQRQSTDPLDLVYGLLSLVKLDRDPIIPDYRKSISAVYTDVTRRLIRERNSLIIICQATNESLTKFDCLGSEEVVPTWVPDFTQYTQSSIRRNSLSAQVLDSCSVSLPFDVDLSLSETDDILRIQCIKWDTIQHIFRTHSDTVPPSAPYASVYVNSQALKQLCNIMLLSGDFFYPTGEDIASVFFSTIRRFPFNAANRQSNFHQLYKRGFYEWFNDDLGCDQTEQTEEELTAKGLELSKKKMEGGLKGFVWYLINFALTKSPQSFFITEKGYFGVMKAAAKIGDRVIIANGAPFPLVVRAVGNQHRGKNASIPAAGFHTLVGEAYVRGIMDGEVINLAGCEAHDTVFLI